MNGQENGIDTWWNIIVPWNIKEILLFMTWMNMEDFMPMTKVRYNDRKADTTPWELETQIHSRN